MSSFAEKHLLKLGWKQGQGLGKDNQGDSNPIKVSTRYTSGIGLGSSSSGKHLETEYFEWWDSVYNASASGQQTTQIWRPLSEQPCIPTSPTAKDKNNVNSVLKLMQRGVAGGGKGANFVKQGHQRVVGEDALETLKSFGVSVSSMSDAQLFDHCGRRIISTGARRTSGHDDSDDDSDDAEFKQRQMSLRKLEKEKGKSEKKSKLEKRNKSEKKSCKSEKKRDRKHKKEKLEQKKRSPNLK